MEKKIKGKKAIGSRLEYSFCLHDHICLVLHPPYHDPGRIQSGLIDTKSRDHLAFALSQAHSLRNAHPIQKELCKKGAEMRFRNEETEAYIKVRWVS